MSTSVCFYFQVHQPFRLRKDYNFFSIGSSHDYEDFDANRGILRKVADKCYLPTNQVMLDLIKKHEGRFKIAYSISGITIEQFEMYAPEVLDSFKRLVDTGCVEIIGETYYHSLAFIRSKSEFREQVQCHMEKMKSTFGVTPTVFRNTELIYNNELAKEVQDMGFKAVIAEGVDRVLGWRSPNFLYQPVSANGIKLLLKNYKLSDDIAFRFSNRGWEEYPLTSEKFAHWVHQTAGAGNLVNLFMDYETFGEHQWADTGIFDFLKALPDRVFQHPDFDFATPSEIADRYEVFDNVSMPDFTSWADIDRDLTAWVGNELQNSLLDTAYSLEEPVKKSGDKDLIHTWRKLLTSDHYYYACTKWDNDGDVHKYFSPYESAYDAYLTYVNVINDLKWTLNQRGFNC